MAQSCTQGCVHIKNANMEANEWMCVWMCTARHQWVMGEADLARSCSIVVDRGLTRRPFVSILACPP